MALLWTTPCYLYPPFPNSGTLGDCLKKFYLSLIHRIYYQAVHICVRFFGEKCIQPRRITITKSTSNPRNYTGDNLKTNYQHIQIIIACLFTFVYAALAKNDFEVGLPPTENLLLHFAANREEMLTNLVTFIKSECGNKIITTNKEGKAVVTYRRKLRLCYFPAKLTAYYKIQARIFLSKQELIYFPDFESLAEETPSDKSKWNLEKILSQNYILRPTPNGMSASIDQIAELLTQKKEILQELDVVGQEIKKIASGKSLLSYYLIPSLKASINNVTPLGAMLELFKEIKCDLNDRFCLYLKGRIGAVLNEISLIHGHTLTGFVNRFRLYTETEATQKVERLKKLLEFNLAYHNSSVSDRPAYLADLKSSIEYFVADGEGSFVNDRFQTFAQHILVLTELSHFAQHLVNLSPYANDLPVAKRKQAAKALLPKINDSINMLETQFKLLGFDEELGG